MAHKKVLLYLDRDQFIPFNYKEEPDRALFVQLGGNSGNSVFQFALQSILSDLEVEVTTELFRYHTYLQEDSYYNKINENYDCVVYSPANIFSEFAKDEILALMTKIIGKLTIPVYAIGLGAQSNEAYSFDFLQTCKQGACQYVKALLKTGGKIGVRGYFTGDCLKKLGFTEKDFEVIGCPSMFVKGKSLRIEKGQYKEETFRPLFNGFRLWNDAGFHQYFKKYPSSIFVCQDEFYRLLYSPEALTWKEYQYLDEPEGKWVKQYLQDRIKLYGDFPSWYHDIQRLEINFSFGCRIHGNVVPLLAGVPAYIDMFDSRVRELAEYFNIPGETFYEGFPDPYVLYQKADYKRFNQEFPEKFIQFEKFLVSCGLSYRKQAAEIPNWDAPIIMESSKRIICEQTKVHSDDEEELKKHVNRKKLVLVAHEFGLFRGNGGIASYLYQLAGSILQHYPGIKVYVLAATCDTDCDLLKKKNFFMDILPGGSLEGMGDYVLKKLLAIEPDYVEVAEYLGLCLESLIYRREKGGRLKNTLFFVDHHTASRECFEWSTGLPFKLAGTGEKHAAVREYGQMILADQNICPSEFLTDYVKKRYALERIETIRHPVNFELESKEKLRQRIFEAVELTGMENKFVISCISRFEGRKRQKLLIDAFISFVKKTDADACLILAGNTSEDVIRGGDVRQFLFEATPKEFRSRIQFLDFVQKREKDLIYAVSDLAVMASAYENYPVAMTEYVFKGVPVMASRCSGCADFMKETAELMTFPPFEPEKLVENIIRFYRLSGEERTEIAEKELSELCRLSDPRRAIYQKLKFFYVSEGKKSIGSLKNRRKFLEAGALKDKAEPGTWNLVLYPEEAELLANYFMNRYETELTEEQLVFVFGCQFGHTLVDELCASEIVFLPGITVQKEEQEKRWYEVLAEILLEREEHYVFLPTGSNHRNIPALPQGIYKLLIDEIFMRRNAICMEELYEA